MDALKIVTPKIRKAANGAGRFARNGYGRGAATVKRLRYRLSRPVPAGMPPVWNRQMTQILLLSVFATAFAAIFDPYFRPFAGPPPNVALEFLRDITDVAKSGWYIVPAVIIVAIIGLLDWQSLRHASRRALLTAYGQAGFILASVAVPGIVVNIIKQFVGRARPRIVEDAGVYGFSPFQFDHAFQSFPSGHATTAGSLAVILMLWHPKARIPLFLAMTLLACGRIPAGAHYPSDVVAGFSLGAIMALTFARWLARRRAIFRFRDGALFPVLTGK
jgi:membrane-associated phospholipid phosphatase